MRIAEVSQQYDISADTLRYYERVGLLGPVRRTKSGVRDYSAADCARIEFIKCMRRANVSIDALSTYINLLKQGDETHDQRLELLREQRDLVAVRIAGMQESLNLLNHKIEHYDDTMAQAERKMM